MDMHSRNQYLWTLQRKYLNSKSRKGKTEILNQYCRDTGQNRKYVIRKINGTIFLGKKEKRKREVVYDGYVTAALAKVWEIFDYSCGQRLVTSLREEIDRLRKMNELVISDRVAEKLKKISSATIDRKLHHEKEVRHLLYRKGQPKPAAHLKKLIPIKLNDWDTLELGNEEIDLVAHCGSSAEGDFINSLSCTDISSGWWEGQALMGKSQRFTLEALEKTRKRAPFDWKGIHSDNGSEFINHFLYEYTQKENLEFSRSRSYRKNDNAYVEQKNWTHVRKILGYLRYDTEKELKAINDLYSKLRLYKNFFQPVMKLIKKKRVGGRLKRKYDIPKTPYQRVTESGQISEKTKEELKSIYLSLNPAQLKRDIETKLENLYSAYEKKKKSILKVDPYKKLTPRTVTSLIIQPIEEAAHFGYLVK